jgi:hypothetical protein
MADSSESGMASNLVSQAATRAGDVAGWLENRDPSAILEDVKRFARRRPGVFIAIAAGTGILVGRLAKSLTSGDESSSSTDTSRYTGDSFDTADYTTAGTTAGYSDGYVAPAGYVPTPDYNETPGYTSGDVR